MLPCPLIQISFLPAAEVATGALRLGDVADMKRLPAAMRARAGAVELPWRMRHDGTVSVAAIAVAAGARMPALACALGTPFGQVHVHVRRPVDERHAAPPTRPAPAVTTGDMLVLPMAIGAVRVIRQVTALQPAVAGQRLFVADGEGKLLSVRYAKDAQ